MMNHSAAPAPVARVHTAVVGAGPYGLSTAAHLRARRIDARVFGTPLGLWRDHMPNGMLLRSHAWASSLSDPANALTLERFCRERARSGCYPIHKDTFVDYGLWFQERAVPDVDPVHVSTIVRRGAGFLLTLQDGRQILSAAVVMATGPAPYAHRPVLGGEIPAGRLSHSCDHSDLGRFKGMRVMVIGAGQSAIESAALLHEAGACVDVVARRAIEWRARDRDGERSLPERLRAPRASVAPGWENWILDHAPYLFYRLPQPRKDRFNGNYSSGAAHWLSERVRGKVTLHEGQIIAAVEMNNGTMRACLAPSGSIETDHILFATGYKVDLARLTMIAPPLREQIRTQASVPLLTRNFESTVPGLYFVGFTALRAFGPIFRFVAGCRASARRVAMAIDRDLR